MPDGFDGYLALPAHHQLTGEPIYRCPERSHCFGLSLFRQSSLKHKFGTSMRSNALSRQLSSSYRCPGSGTPGPESIYSYKEAELVRTIVGR